MFIIPTARRPKALLMLTSTMLSALVVSMCSSLFVLLRGRMPSDLGYIATDIAREARKTHKCAGLRARFRGNSHANLVTSLEPDDFRSHRTKISNPSLNQ